MPLFTAGRRALARLGVVPIAQAQCAWYATAKPTPPKSAEKQAVLKSKAANSASPMSLKTAPKRSKSAKTTPTKKTVSGTQSKQPEPAFVVKPASPAAKPLAARSKETSAKFAVPAPIKPAGSVYIKSPASAAQVTARPVEDKAPASVPDSKVPTRASAPKVPDVSSYPRPLWEPPKPANPLKDPNSKEYKEKYRRETIRWTMIMTGGPIAIVTSYFLWDRLKHGGVPVHQRGGRDPLAPEENVHKKSVTF